MKISVVTVCLNAEATIAASIGSFQTQRHRDKELIVVDGGSQDATLDIVRSFVDPAIRLISEKDEGIYDAMNKGLQHFSGAAVGFLNADDVLHDEQVLTRIAVALRHADVVYGDLLIVRDHATRTIVRKWTSGTYSPGCFRNGWMPPHPTFYIRRDLAKMTGLFDVSYRIAADYDFMLRAMELLSPRVRYIPHTLVDFMMGGVSSGGVAAVIRGNLECLRARRRHLGAPLLDAALVTKPLRKLRQLTWRAGA